MHSQVVGVIVNPSMTYPRVSPFNALRAFPEFPRAERSQDDNQVYQAVREFFLRMGYDAAHHGREDWNPLGWLVKPGETVFIKPNFISEGATEDKRSWEHVITHGSVIRTIVDYVHKALNGKGRIVIGDSPQTDSDFEAILQKSGLLAIQESYRRREGFKIEILDLRNERWIEFRGVHSHTVKLPGDPAGTCKFSLAQESYFAEVEHLGRKYYGAFYDVEETNRHHQMGKHEYLICRSPIESDVFISIPKLKTHKKVGLTVNLKGLVGINGNKNWLPHYALGSPESTGDQFNMLSTKRKFENMLILRAKKLLMRDNRLMRLVAGHLKKSAYRVFGATDTVIRSGNWYGNDTCWRMCLDLNKILLYGNPDGTLRPNDKKRYFSLVDGIVAMEGNGPVSGSPRTLGLLVGGSDALSVDMVCAKLMGFDYTQIKLLSRAYDKAHHPLNQCEPEEIVVTSNHSGFDGRLNEISKSQCFNFEPHFGWKGHIELS